MCGRYALAVEAEELVEAFDVPLPGFEVRPRFNVAPGEQAPVVAEDRRGRRMGLLTWGLVPAWQDDPAAGFINARSESVLDKPSFREAFKRRRCLVPASGFYEWKREEEGKVPYWIHPPGGGVISFAGIWERWMRSGAEPRHTYAILTMAPNADVAPIHDRMPVVIAEADRGAWLNRATDDRGAMSLVHKSLPVSLVSYPVSTRVNRPQEDDAGLLEPVG
jgi:putative SOS response-associated peptidase YedK